MILRKLLLTTVFVLLAAGAVSGDTLYTTVVSPSYRTPFSELVQCVILNVGEKASTVTIQVVAAPYGEPYKTSTEELGPGSFAALLLDNMDPGWVYCRFDVDGNAKNFRASLCHYTEDGGYYVCTPAY